MSNERRLGKFTVTRDLIRKSPECVRQVMGECIIWDVQRYEAHGSVTYVAESPRFDLVPEGHLIPEYFWIFGTFDRGTELLDCQRVSPCE